jgi:hypothetical protein
LPWLKSHPDIDIVSRDRASAYADVQIEGESCRIRKRYLPFFASYCQKSCSPDHSS